MKELVRLERTVTVGENVEAEFPIYRKEEFDYGNIIIVTKVTLHKELKVRIKYDEYEVDECRIELKEASYNYSKEYFLGLNEYACTKDEFNRVLREALGNSTPFLDLSEGDK